MVLSVLLIIDVKKVAASIEVAIILNATFIVASFWESVTPMNNINVQDLSKIRLVLVKLIHEIFLAPNA